MRVPQETIRLNGYNRADTGCKALLVISPKAFLGWCPEMQENAVFEVAQEGMSGPQGAWYSTNSDALGRFQCQDAASIAERLWDIYWAQEARSLVRFDAILDALTRLYASWIRMQEGSS